MTSSSDLPSRLETVGDGGGDDDGGAMLIVVEDRNAHALAKPALDFETFRRLDVLEIDRAEGRLEGGDDLHQLVRSVSSSSMSKASMPANFLKRTALPFHDRLGTERADRAQAENGRAVGDHADQIAPGGQIGGLGRIFRDHG